MHEDRNDNPYATLAVVDHPFIEDILDLIKKEDSPISEQSLGDICYIGDPRPSTPSCMHQSNTVVIQFDNGSYIGCNYRDKTFTCFPPAANLFAEIMRLLLFWGYTWEAVVSVDHMDYDFSPRVDGGRPSEEPVEAFLAHAKLCFYDTVPAQSATYLSIRTTWIELSGGAVIMFRQYDDGTGQISFESRQYRSVILL